MFNNVITDRIDSLSAKEGLLVSLLYFNDINKVDSDISLIEQEYGKPLIHEIYTDSGVVLLLSPTAFA